MLQSAVKSNAPAPERAPEFSAAVIPLAPQPAPHGAAPARPAPSKVTVEPPAARIGRWLRANGTSLILWCLSLLGLFAFWYLGTRYRWEFFIRFTNVPTPAEVFAKVLEVNQSPKYLQNIAISLRRILLGFCIAALVAIPIGLAVGRYRRIRDLLLPAFEVLRPIPAIAWVPISIMLWPTNEVSIVFITFLGSFFPILLNTIHGVTAIDPVLLRAGRCLGAGEARMFSSVILPGALPHVFTGLAVGMGVAWVSLIAAEMISGQFGVGYFTWEAYSLVSYAEIVLGMITIGVLGLACSGAIRWVGKLAMPWLAFGTEARR